MLDKKVVNDRKTGGRTRSEIVWKPSVHSKIASAGRRAKSSTLYACLGSGEGTVAMNRIFSLTMGGGVLPAEPRHRFDQLSLNRRACVTEEPFPEHGFEQEML
jgi:hypothetical protein